MKVCWSCETEKPEWEFYPVAKGDEVGPRASSCKACTKANYLAWNETHRPEIAMSNRQNRKSRNAAYKAKKRAIVDEVRNRPCMDCEGVFPSLCMDLDHVRGTKVANISMMVDKNNYSYDDLADEIAKCEVVCSNCHRIRTNSRGWGIHHKIPNLNLSNERESV